jgi:hypothetical protein
MEVGMLQKFGDVDLDELREKMGLNRSCSSRFNFILTSCTSCSEGKIPESKQEQRFLAHLWPEIRKLCMVRSYVIMEEMMAAAKDVEKVLGELGETPFDLLKEQEEDMIVDAVMEKQVNVIMSPLKILRKLFHLM